MVGKEVYGCSTRSQEYKNWSEIGQFVHFVRCRYSYIMRFISMYITVHELCANQELADCKSIEPNNWYRTINSLNGEPIFALVDQQCVFLFNFVCPFFVHMRWRLSCKDGLLIEQCCCCAAGRSDLSLQCHWRSHHYHRTMRSFDFGTSPIDNRRGLEGSRWLVWKWATSLVVAWHEVWWTEKIVWMMMCRHTWCPCYHVGWHSCYRVCWIWYYHVCWHCWCCCCWWCWQACLLCSGCFLYS